MHQHNKNLKRITMHKILSATFIAPNIKRFTIEAPKIALKRKAGQFVIIRISDVGERIPLTIDLWKKKPNSKQNRFCRERVIPV